MSAIPVEIGRVVVSRCGRDEGRRFLVVREVDADFVLIADGKTRKAEKLKKKRRRHLIATATISSDMRDRLLAGEVPKDHEIAACVSKEEG